MEMDEKWVKKKKEEVEEEVKKLKLWNEKKIEKIEIEIDKEKEPEKSSLESLIKELLSGEKINYNKYLIVEEKDEGKIRYEQKEKEVGGEKKIDKAIADILGQYSFENEIHKITFFEKNIIKCKDALLKDRLLAILRHLAICIPPWYSDRNHFPMEYPLARRALDTSDNYEKFIKEISKFLIEELDFWKVIHKFKEKEQKEIDLSKKIDLLNICEREIFDCLYEIVFLHELGHMVHHLSLYNYKNFQNLNSKIKEAFADLYALFSAKTLKEKIIFYSLAQISNQSWFEYYKKFYKKDFIEKIGNRDAFINFLKEEIK